MSTFIQSIVEYQEKGDRTVIDSIMNATKNNLFEIDLQNQSNPESELFIATKIKAMQERMGRYAKHYRAGNYEEYMELDEYLKEYGNWVNIRYTVDEAINLKGKEWKELADFFRDDDIFFWNIEHFKKLDVIVQSEKKKIIDRVNKFSVAALEHAFRYVKTNKTDKEIVRYVCISWRSKFGELLMGDSELIRKRYYSELGVRKSKLLEIQWKDIDEVLFGKTFKFVGGMEKVFARLKEKDLEFANRLVVLIHDDLENKNIEAFRTNKKGETILNKRHTAMRLGMEEAAFKMKLSRLTKKLYEIVNQLRDEKLSQYPILKKLA